MPETTSKKMVWDQIGEKLYETGVEQVALFPMANGAYTKGVPWNGVTAFNVTPSGAEPNKFYANNKNYLTLMSPEEVGATVECYTYPKEFKQCLGFAAAVAGVYVGQQTRTAFGLVTKTIIGNDTEMNSHGYKLHILYNALAKPSEESHATVNETIEPGTFSYELSTTPIDVPGFAAAAYICIDSTEADAEKLKALEAIIYGSEDAEPRLPLPGEVLTTLGTVAAG